MNTCKSFQLVNFIVTEMNMQVIVINLSIQSVIVFLCIDGLDQCFVGFMSGGNTGLGTNASLAGNFAALPQRGAVSGPQFRGNNSTPTSMNLPYNLQTPQQQPSPSR